MNSEYIIDLRNKYRLTQSQLAEILGVALRTVQNWESDSVIPKTKQKAILQFEKRMIDESNLAKVDYDTHPIIETPDIITNKRGDTFVRLNDGRYQMSVKIVEPYAYAGYLSGYEDSEYIDDLPNHTIVVDELKRGFYRAFRVKGDSMDADIRKAIPAGSVVTGRNIDKSLWSSKLHINSWNEFVIVCEDGIVIKQILEHNVEEGTIKCHSYNEDKDSYPDYTIHLSQVQQLFNVVKVEVTR